MGTKTTSNKCQKYLTGKVRIRNKQKELDRRLKRLTKEESKDAIIKSCRIGREKEDFKKEEFKFKAKKIKEKK